MKKYLVMSVNSCGWTMYHCSKGAWCHNLSSKCVALYDYDEAMRIAEECKELAKKNNETTQYFVVER